MQLRSLPLIESGDGRNQGLKAKEQCVVIFPKEQKLLADSPGFLKTEPIMHVCVYEATSVFLAGSGKYE